MSDVYTCPVCGNVVALVCVDGSFSADCPYSCTDVCRTDYSGLGPSRYEAYLDFCELNARSLISDAMKLAIDRLHLIDIIEEVEKAEGCA